MSPAASQAIEDIVRDVAARGIDLPDTCQCGASNLRHGDRWESHLADITVAALTQAGHLGVGRIPDQHVPEAVGLLPVGVRTAGEAVAHAVDWLRLNRPRTRTRS